MRKYIKIVSAAFIICIPGFHNAFAQDDIGEYMNHISKANEKITTIYLSYLSAVGHNKSARKVEKRRQEVLTSIFDTPTASAISSCV